MLNAYLLLGISIAFELLGTSMLAATKGWTVPKYTAFCITCYGICYLFFGLCLEDIDLSVAYATWGAVGMVVTPIVGYLFYHQQLTKIGLFAVALIIGSVVTLNLWGW
jgi:small multidrug resistance pump